MGTKSVTSESEKNNNNVIKEAVQWLLAIVIAIVLALLIRGFVFEQALVVGDSMQDTLFDGQRLIVFKTGYFFSPPKRGDIVILKYQEGSFKYLPIPDPNEIDYIKRVIGVPGDEVDIRDGSVYINGEKLDEPYAKGITEPIAYGIEFPLVVPENKVFVLGDNRENSSDSRQIGLIDFERIKGKAVFRVYPFNVFGSIY